MQKCDINIFYLIFQMDCISETLNVRWSKRCRVYNAHRHAISVPIASHDIIIHLFMGNITTTHAQWQQYARRTMTIPKR